MDPVYFCFYNRVALKEHFHLLELCICYVINRESKVVSICDFHEVAGVTLQINNHFYVLWKTLLYDVE